MIVHPELTSRAGLRAAVEAPVRRPDGTWNIKFTVAVFRPWRGSQCSAAQDPAPDEAMKTHEDSCKNCCTLSTIFALAEREGFEPSRAIHPTSFPGPRTRPDYATSPLTEYSRGGEFQQVFRQPEERCKVNAFLQRGRCQSPYSMK